MCDVIYLDNAATTRVSPQAVEAATNCMLGVYYNASSTHNGGIEAASLLRDSRMTVAHSMGCKPEEVFFVSCATEANNWVIKNGFKNKNGNLIISEGEHPSVYEAALSLRSKGYDVRIVPLTADGTVDEGKLLSAVDDKTALVSVMHCSNETGVINDIKRLCGEVKKINPTTLFHSDGVQAFTKFAYKVSDLGVDFYSVSGHKIGAPKGIGALYVRHGIRLAPLLNGGEQENGMRSGTENLPAIVAFSAALKDIPQFDASIYEHWIKRLNEIGGVKINGYGVRNNGRIISVSVPNMKAEVLQHVLSDKGVYIGIGSACASRKRGNRTLSSMGLKKTEIEGSVRISFSPDNTLEETILAADRFLCAVAALRGERIG